MAACAWRLGLARRNRPSDWRRGFGRHLRCPGRWTSCRGRVDPRQCGSLRALTLGRSANGRLVCRKGESSPHRSSFRDRRSVAGAHFAVATSPSGGGNMPRRTCAYTVPNFFRRARRGQSSHGICFRGHRCARPGSGSTSGRSQHHSAGGGLDRWPQTRSLNPSQPAPSLAGGEVMRRWRSGRRPWSCLRLGPAAVPLESAQVRTRCKVAPVLTLGPSIQGGDASARGSLARQNRLPIC